ncbi:MAG TPA: ABC transporter ATP-binding protein [Myxococcota bacterium]|nr:ABC transporter ATP-binding protein [Myxococcota bacterium]
MNALEAVGVAKDYGPVRALDGIDLELAAGTIALLRGPNGAGKSTLLRVLGALTRPTQGSVRLLSRDPFSSRDAAVRARLGFLGQDAALYGELTVAENLRFAARLRGADEGELLRVSELWALGPVLDRRARTLSQGFRRRVGLARALLGEPALLLLDEPWNGLDAASAERLSRLLDELRARGVAVLVASHAAGIALPKFDRELALERGRLT